MKEKKKTCGQLSPNSALALAQLLEREKDGEFVPSDSFDGVMIRYLIEHESILSKIPEIPEYIRTFGRPVTELFIVEAVIPIPMHFHKENEMYVGGRGGVVTLRNPGQRDETAHVMHPIVFTTVLCGGSHSLTINPPTREISLLGIKF